MLEDFPKAAGREGTGKWVSQDFYALSGRSLFMKLHAAETLRHEAFFQ